MVDDDISLRTRFALDLGTGAESDSSASNIKISWVLLTISVLNDVESAQNHDCFYIIVSANGLVWRMGRMPKAIKWKAPFHF